MTFSLRLETQLGFSVFLQYWNQDGWTGVDFIPDPDTDERICLGMIRNRGEVDLQAVVDIAKDEYRARESYGIGIGFELYDDDGDFVDQGTLVDRGY